LTASARTACRRVDRYGAAEPPSLRPSWNRPAVSNQSLAQVAWHADSAGTGAADIIIELTPGMQ
jgi:hypothetical protein